MKPRRSVKTSANTLAGFSEDFMSERNQPPLQERASLQNEKQNNAQLPAGWEWKTLGEACTVILGQSPESTTYNTEKNGLPFFQGKAEFGSRYPTVVKWCSHPKKVALKDDILMSVRAPVGPTNFAASECCIGRGLAAIRPTERVDHLYVFYYLRKIEHELSEMGTGTTFKAISGDVLRSIEIPLAPIDQQKIIVEEIEKQFSRLDEAVAGLKRIKANLKRYKAAVLKAAVEGKLTEEWRKTHPNVETGAELLKRILSERKRNWEEKNPGKKYKEHVAPDTSNLPELPEGWVWTTWEMLLAPEDGAFRRGPFGSTLRKSIFVESGYKVYEQYCPINDDPSFARYFITEKKYEEMEQFAVKAGDFLISCSGTLGRITQVPKTYAPGVINQALLRVRMNSSAIDTAFFMHLFRSSYFQKLILENTQGAAIQNVKGVKELKSISIPLPPLDEQIIILQLVEEQLSIISDVERQFALNLKRAERLRQTILKKVFSGQLSVNCHE